MTESLADQTTPGPPPYGAALGAGLVVLCVYLLTLAPTVTFWDAGEFLAAAKVLGIPHPPGTPLFVLLGHVWGTFFPFGEFAWRLNLLSALFGASASVCWFLVAHETLGPLPEVSDRRMAVRIRLGGASAAALLSGFAFTVWQNANETEVYAVSSFTIAAIAWLALRWRAARATPRRDRPLLLVVYLLGVSLGNHLLALLAGPAVLLFVLAEIWRHPSGPLAERRKEWGRLLVLGGLWLLLLATGLGSVSLLKQAGGVLLVVFAIAVWARCARFALVTLLIASVGVTPYAYLYLRSQQSPTINEAAPTTLKALGEVIRRAQYPPRTPLDDPTQLSGENNPGRTASLAVLQVQNYLQYFDWQWGKAIPGTLPGGLPVRTLLTLLVASLGFQGLFRQRETDRAGWWLMFGIWGITGLGLVMYMNFRPGFSLGYDQFPNPADHEVRERDYFFLVSFAVWGVWAGMGLARIAAAAVGRMRTAAIVPAIFALALLPVFTNGTAASRRHGPEARLAADFAYDLLNSVPPYGILFTFGDNDTFPLWWAQEVEGIRRDVTIVCLALAETDWYMRQLRNNPTRPFDREGAPAIWRDGPAVAPEWPLHTMTDAEIDAAVPQRLRAGAVIALGEYDVNIPAGTVLLGKDFVSIRILQQNLGRRPIAWGLGAAGEYHGLQGLVVQEGLVMRLRPVPPDPADPSLDFSGLLGAPLDLPLTQRLMAETYRYGGLPESGVRDVPLDPTVLSVAATLGLPFLQVALALEARGDTAGAGPFYLRAKQFSTNSAIDEGIRRAALPR